MRLKGPGFHLSKKVGRAMTDYRMLSDGDRIAVGVSGGKDSLSLLHILHSRQAFCPIKYKLVVVHIDLGYSSRNINKLKNYLKRTGYEYAIKKLKLSPKGKSSPKAGKQDKSCGIEEHETSYPIPQGGAGETVPHAWGVLSERSERRRGACPPSGRKSARREDFGNRRSRVSCFWCSWNRRKMLFETAAEFKCNKVALGHHLDDIAQTILLNLFFNSEISAMSPRQELFSGQLTIIRPLAYVQENEITRFAKQEKLPYYKYNCANSLISNRRRIARIIRDLEKICPNLKTNIFRSLKRIKKDYLL